MASQLIIFYVLSVVSLYKKQMILLYRCSKYLWEVYVILISA